MVAPRFLLPFLLSLLSLSDPLPSACAFSSSVSAIDQSGADESISHNDMVNDKRMEYELEKRRHHHHHHHHHGHHHYHHYHHYHHHHHHHHQLVPGVASSMPMPVDLLKDQAREKIYERHAAKEFLDGHNSLRDYFGEPRFRWNKTLAQYARDYLKQKKVSCGKEHSGGPYGENLFWGTGNRWRAVDAVQKWAMEHYYYNEANNSCLNGRMCGHYTQMVWKSSLMIGCARMVCKTGDVLVLCSYDPPGNYVGERPFQESPLA